MSIGLWVTCGGSGATGSHRFAYFLPEDISPLRVAVGNDLLRETDMGDDFIENHLGGLLLCKVGRGRNEEGIFGERADEDEDGVETLTFRKFSYKIHGDDFESLHRDRDGLK